MTEHSLLWHTAMRPVSYPDAVDAMRAHVAAIRAGAEPERIWLLEHPALFTAGTSARAQDLFNPLGFPTFESSRGGQWTYHGPGQRVVYVMLNLQRPHGMVPARDVRAFVAGLEAWLIRTLAVFGVRGELRDGRIGVWVADPATGRDNKIAALGVRLTRWVSWHGVSLNIDPDLHHFDGIVPCGIREHGVTSLRALGVDADIDAVDAALRRSWGGDFWGWRLKARALPWTRSRLSLENPIIYELVSIGRGLFRYVSASNRIGFTPEA